MPKPATRDAIFEAARQLFSERGYEDTSMRDIAARAGFSLPTLYRNYENKRALFEGLYSDRVRHLWTSCFEAVEGDDAMARLHAAIRAGARALRQDKFLCTALRYWFAPANEQIGLAQFDRFLRMLTPLANSIYASLDGAGLSPRRDPEACLVVIVSTLMGYCARPDIWGDDMSIDRVADTLVYFLTQSASRPEDAVTAPNPMPLVLA